MVMSGLWRLAPLTTIFFVISRSVYYWKKLEYPAKTTDKPYHIMLIAQVVVNPTTMRSRPRRPLIMLRHVVCSEI